ncbi:hypothetical protein [Methylomagnum ishizawai]|uniref:hypothetical protein n=1 Tax=Methylomagnum ishizawai TaxID=1760988 RepID=UPI001C32496B|nr:hypothetical protein [Methylomagnum ishizawai]BBL74183.1 hypothetical protein MishRS11D_12810 [Methylomagnum ishizawai]
MALIRFSGFKGEAPRVAPHQLPQGFAQTALNVDLRRGMLEPLHDPAVEIADVGAAEALFLHSSGKWLLWSDPVNVVEGVVAADTTGRVFWTDGVYPKQSNTALLDIAGDFALDPAHFYRLGLPAPEAAPVVTVAEDVPDEYSVSRTFVYCWVHRATLGTKSSDITVSVGPGQSAYLSGLDTTPPTVFPTGGATAKANTFRKFLLEYDAATGSYVLVKKLAYDDSDYTDDGTVRGKRYKASAFQSAKIVAPSGGSAAAVDAVPDPKNDRDYVYCWLYQESGGTWKRTAASSAATVADVTEADAVLVADMAEDYATPFPDGAHGIRKAVFRTDGNGDLRLVAKVPKNATQWRDTQPTKKLGQKIGHWTVGLSGVPATPTAEIVSEADTEVVSVAYVQTWVSAWGEESAPSPVSNTLDLYPWQEASIATTTAAPDGYDNITQKRLYRTDVTGTFRLATTLDLAVGDWVDALADEDLGDPIETTLWDAPPDDLQGLVGLPNGVLAGIAGNQVVFSETDVPYAYPVAYRYTVPDPVALAVVDGGVLVLTQNHPYLCRGFDPASAVPELIRERAACVSARSVVDMGGWAMWASPDGLMSTRSGSPALETAGLLTREQWQGFAPSSLVGGFWQGRYVGFYDAGETTAAFVFDLEGGFLALVEVVAAACWNHAATDRLFVVAGGDLGAWNEGAAKTLTWKSGRALVDAAMTPLCARVDADAYPVSFKLYADGVLKLTQSVLNHRAFRLPGGYRGFGFEVEVSGTAQVRQVVAASTMEELAG